jgi:hypothetical protein
MDAWQIGWMLVVEGVVMLAVGFVAGAGFRDWIRRD